MKGRMKTFSVNVTQEDIDNGEILTSRFCPVALALKRTFKGKVEAFVGVREATVIFRRFLIPDKKVTINFPSNVRTFIVDFDSEKPVSPVSFLVWV